MLQSLQYFNLNFLFNFFLIFFFDFTKKLSLSFDSRALWEDFCHLEAVPGRHRAKDWLAAHCWRRYAHQVTFFFSIYSRFPWFPRQLHHSLYFCTCPKNVVADLCVCSVQPGPVAQAAALLRPEGSSEPRGEIRLWPASQRIQLHHRGRRVRLAQECVCGVLSQ